MQPRTLILLGLAAFLAYEWSRSSTAAAGGAAGLSPDVAAALARLKATQAARLPFTTAAGGGAGSSAAVHRPSIGGRRLNNPDNVKNLALEQKADRLNMNPRYVMSQVDRQMRALEAQETQSQLDIFSEQGFMAANNYGTGAQQGVSYSGSYSGEQQQGEQAAVGEAYGAGNDIHRSKYGTVVFNS